MQIFKRILNSKKEVVDPSERRQNKRYNIGQSFQFKAVLSLGGRDSLGNLAENGAAEQDWAGRLANLSETGVGIQLHPAAVAVRGENCRLKLSLNDYALEIPGIIAYYRAYQQYALLGLSYRFPDSESYKAYLQVLEPVIIGASLAPVDSKKVRHDAAGLLKEQYQGQGAALLSVWRKPAGAVIFSFDFRMNDYGVRWSEGMTEVEPYGLSKLNLAGKKTDSPFIHLTDAELEEVRWLFCLAVPNVPKAVPLDIRKFLATLIA